VNRSLLWLASIAAAAAAVLVWSRATTPPDPPPAVQVLAVEETFRPAAVADESARSRRGPSRRENGVEGRSPETAGTEDGTATPAAPPPTAVVTGLRVDASGNFYPEAGTVDRFESMLATDQPVDRSLAAIRDDIARHLDPPAEQQALEFLDRYMAYRNRGIELGLNQDVTEDFTPRFAQLRSLRREFFGIDVGQRLFGEQERAANIAIREAEILGDTDLSEEEKAKRLAEIHNPPPEQNE
jgi:hypothetical protein